MDDPVDPYPEIKSKCAEKSHCKDAMDKYEACTVRVTNKGFGTCEPWFFDYLKCVDHCDRLKSTTFSPHFDGNQKEAFVQAAPQILKVLK